MNTSEHIFANDYTPKSTPSTIIFHIDVNSAFLSWEACLRIEQRYCNPDGSLATDLRDIPSVVGGNQEMRHGIVLAKSMPAKKYHIQTGEPLSSARQKCPQLVVVPPNFPVYVECSRKFIELLRKYSPCVEQYSIDEAYCDMTGTHLLYGSPVIFANELREKIHRELGFTVNIGVSSNKLLAKMASDFRKPNLVHTLFPEEVPDKLWPLPVGDLFYVGRQTQKRLLTLGIQTIGELARTDRGLLQSHFGKHGLVMHEYANGRDQSVVTQQQTQNKGYGNSLTIHYDVTDRNAAKMILLSLCETVGARIRADKVYIGVVSISITDCDFAHLGKQMTLESPTNVTKKIYEVACLLFDKLWNNHPIRALGVSTSRTSHEQAHQYHLFESESYEKLERLDHVIDGIRSKYGEDSIKRARFLSSDQDHMSGGTHKEHRRGISGKEIAPNEPPFEDMES